MCYGSVIKKAVSLISKTPFPMSKFFILVLGAQRYYDRLFFIICRHNVNRTRLFLKYHSLYEKQHGSCHQSLHSNIQRDYVSMVLVYLCSYTGFDLYPVIADLFFLTFFVMTLPIDIIFPCFIMPYFLHQSTSISSCSCTFFPDFISAIRLSSMAICSSL